MTDEDLMEGRRTFTIVYLLGAGPLELWGLLLWLVEHSC